MVSERAQLILVGSITIALLVIGIALVVNTVLFTENLQTDTTAITLDESSAIDAEVQEGVRSTTLRVNHRVRNQTQSEIHTWVEENVTRFGALMSEAQVDANRLTVTVSYDRSASETGFRVVQSENGSYESTSGATDWDPVPAGDHRVGWFVVNVNATSTGESAFFANASNPSGETLNVSVNKTDDTTFNVTTTTSLGSATTVNCDTQGGRLLLNLHTGRSFTDDDCTFTGTRRVGNVSRIHFENGDGIAGEYAVVVNDSDDLTVGDCSAATPVSISYAPVV